MRRFCIIIFINIIVSPLLFAQRPFIPAECRGDKNIEQVRDIILDYFYSKQFEHHAKLFDNEYDCHNKNPSVLYIYKSSPLISRVSAELAVPYSRAWELIGASRQQAGFYLSGLLDFARLQCRPRDDSENYKWYTLAVRRPETKIQCYDGRIPAPELSRRADEYLSSILAYRGDLACLSELTLALNGRLNFPENYQGYIWSTLESVQQENEHRIKRCSSLDITFDIEECGQYQGICQEYDTVYIRK